MKPARPQLIVVGLAPEGEAGRRLIQYRNPEAVLLCVPANAHARADAYLGSLSQTIQRRTAVVSPRDALDNLRVLKRRIGKGYAAGDVEICLNSGPYALRLAALQLARSAGYRLSCVNLETMQIQDPWNRWPAEDMTDSIVAYLQTRAVALGTSYASREKACGSLAETAEYLVERLPLWQEIIRCLRWNGEEMLHVGALHTLNRTRHNLTEDHFAILRKLKQVRLLERLQVADGDVSFLIPCDAYKEFINGKWLEVYVFNQLKGFFGDCRCGQTLRTPSGPREVDFIGLKSGRFTLASCKTSLLPFDSAYLEELQSLSAQIGEPSCARYFVTDGDGHVRDEKGRQFEAFAEEHAITIVVGRDLRNIEAIVRRGQKRWAQSRA